MMKRKSRLQRPRRQAGPVGTLTAADARRLAHELQVHQLELEMQNTELRRARDEAETLLEKYSDLYDFAPVGYLSLDEDGRILDANLTAAALLGVDRSQLVTSRLPRFVASASQPQVRAFMERIFAGPGKQACEAALLRADGTPFWANLHGAAAVAVSGPAKWCWVAVSDITFLKEAQAAQARVEAVTAANLELRGEISRRQAVERELKTSQQQLTVMLAQARHHQDQVRRLSRRVLLAQEEERKRISRELHDDIAQTLVGINVHLQTLAGGAVVNPRRLQQRIAHTQRLVTRAVDIVHRFARDLRPTMLEDLGLALALRAFVDVFARDTNLPVRLTLPATLGNLDTHQRTVLFRVAQEALTNVARHAHATRVALTVRQLPRGVALSVADNGRAFDVERVFRARKTVRLGLLGMRERVEMVGGTLRIESAPGRGTTILVQIPIVSPRARVGGHRAPRTTEQSPL